MLQIGASAALIGSTATGAGKCRLGSGEPLLLTANTTGDYNM